MNRIKPEFVLRLSLAITYFYAGYSLLTSPKSWTQFVPFRFKEALASLDFPITAFVRAQGAMELLLALVFIIWLAPRRWVRFAALLSALEMALILIFTGIDLITFRDIGLLGAALAVFLIYRERR